MSMSFGSAPLAAPQQPNQVTGGQMQTPQLGSWNNPASDAIIKAMMQRRMQQAGQPGMAPTGIPIAAPTPGPAAMGGVLGAPMAAYGGS